jgi:hypothetical protein
MDESTDQGGEFAPEVGVLTPGGCPDTAAGTVIMPDFIGRLKATFGSKVTPDSQSLFDEMRGDY